MLVHERRDLDSHDLGGPTGLDESDALGLGAGDFEVAAPHPAMEGQLLALEAVSQVSYCSASIM